MSNTYLRLIKKNEKNFDRARIQHQRIVRIHGLIANDIASMPSTASVRYREVKQRELECMNELISEYKIFLDSEKTQKGIDSFLAKQDSFLMPYLKISL